MKICAIFGFSKSGKTTTVEGVVSELRRRGYSVASVKDIHNEKFAIDMEGTNTYRHKAAGAQLVTARGLSETDILFQERLSLEQILKIYQLIYEFDYVILEGENEYSGPGIVTGQTLEEVDRKWDASSIRVFAVTGRIADEGIPEYRGVPVIHCMREEGILQLTDLIEQNAEKWGGC